MGNNKKPNLPAMPLYIGDWKKDPAVMAMTPEDEGIYLRLIMLCWESENRGYLQINNKPIPIELLARMINLDNQRLSTWLSLYQNIFSIFGLTDDNIMYSKKQVDILELAEKRKNAGKKGGNPVLKGTKEIRLTTSKPISKPNAITITEDVNEFEIKDKKDNEKSLEYLDNNLDNFRIDEFKSIDIDNEYKKFRDYLKANGKRYKDYMAAFRNWLRSDYVKKNKVVKYGLD